MARLLPALLLLSVSRSSAVVSRAATPFASLISQRDPPEDLARELLSLFEDDAFSRAAKVMVSAEKFHAGATGEAFNTVVHATSPLSYLIDQWSRALDHKWPAPVPHGTLFDASVIFGATGGGDACAVLTAARTRNVGALRALLDVTPPRDVTACLLNATRPNLFAFASSSPSPGTARLFFRGGRVAIGASNSSAEAAAAVRDLRDADGVLFSPALWPTAFKSALEAASPPVELDLLAPYFGVGFAGEAAPRAEDAGTGARLDAAWAAAEDGAPLPAAWAHRASAQDLLMTRDATTGATPILKACASGRSSVLARLLALLPADVTPSSDALHGSPAFGGATCAHLAAASGDVRTLATLTARFPHAVADALYGRDARGRTPCDIAAAGGALLAPATIFLRDAGACGDTAVITEALSRCPSVQRFDDRPELAAARGFDVREHILGGWRMLSPSDLASLSLPPAFLTKNTLNQYERHGRTLARGVTLRRGARRGNTTEDDELESPRFAFACDPSELPASALHEDSATVDALVRDFISTQTPFVVRAAYDPGEALSSSDDGAYSGVPSIHRVYDTFSNLMVDTGERAARSPSPSTRQMPHATQLTVVSPFPLFFFQGRSRTRTHTGTAATACPRMPSWSATWGPSRHCTRMGQ